MIKPHFGDLVRVEVSDDSLIPVGSYGVLEGYKGRTYLQFNVCFNFTTPWWQMPNLTYTHEHVEASGGPVRNIWVKSMKPTKEKREQEFQYFEHSPAAHSAKSIKKTVRVWAVNLVEDVAEWRKVMENAPTHIP